MRWNNMKPTQTNIAEFYGLSRQTIADYQKNHKRRYDALLLHFNDHHNALLSYEGKPTENEYALELGYDDLKVVEIKDEGYSVHLDPKRNYKVIVLEI